MRLRNKIFLCLAGLIVAFLVIPPFAVHHRVKSAVAAYRKQLAEKGEKLNIADLTPHFTADEENSARNLTAAFNRLPFNSNFPPSLKILAPGRGLVCWKEEELGADNSSNLWAGLRMDLAARAQAMETLRAASRKPLGGLNLDYGAVSMIALNHLAPMKHAGLSLSAAAMMDLHDGRADSAMENLIANVMLLHECEREPLTISQLVRIAMGQIALNTTWQVLQYPGWRDSQLAELQSAWASVGFLKPMTSALEMHQVTGPEEFELARKDYSNTVPAFLGTSPTTLDVGNVMAFPRQSYETFVNRYPRYWAWKSRWSYDEELFGLQATQAALGSLRKLQTNIAIAPNFKELDTTFADLRKAYHESLEKFIAGGDDAWIRSSLRRMGSIEMQRQLLLAAIALKRFQLANGKYPDDLKELVPKYLAVVPLDPMDGRPLRYQNKSKSFVLYSVGEDGVDDGGDPIPAKSSPGGNIQWFTGRDAVWPSPATADEVEAYKQKMLMEWESKHGTESGK